MSMASLLNWTWLACFGNTGIWGRMTIVRTFLMAAEVVVAILLIVVVLLQSSKTAGMGGAVGGAADSVFGGKSRGIDGLLAKCTVVLAIIFAALSLGLGIYLNQY